MKAFLWSTASVVLLIGLAAGGLVWGVATYVGIAKERVALDRDWSLVEDAYVHRLDLVPDLLASLERVPRPDRSELSRLSEAARRAGQVIPTPELLDAPDDLAEFLRLQDDLTVRLEPVLSGLRDSGASQGPVGLLVAHLSDAQARIDAERGKLGEAVERFNLSLKGFPNSWVADLLGVRPKQAEPPTRAEG